MKYILIIIISLITLPAFSQKNLEKEKEKLMFTDIEFSNYSNQTTAYDAFIAYAHDKAVLLRANSLPIEGKNEMMKYLNARDTSYKLTWKPLFSDVADSFDLGYTYGIYEVKSYDKGGNSVTKQGTYVSIWRKNKEGFWKFVLDTGNPGIGTEIN